MRAVRNGVADMDRREALKSFAALVSTAGLTVTPLTASDVGDGVVVLRFKDHLSQSAKARVVESWRLATNGTPLDGVRALIFDGDVEVSVLKRSDVTVAGR
jgi:hypothetical protein